MRRGIMIGCVAVSGLTAGCPLPSQPESDQAACVRVMTHTLSCMGDVAEDPEAVQALENLVALACAEMPERPECDWPTLADCVTAVPCDELIGAESFGDRTCDDVLSAFQTNECYGPLFETPEAIEP